MRTLHVDMPSGIAGDMLLAALIHAGASLEGIIEGLDGLGCGRIPLTASAVMAGPLAALRVAVGAPQEATWSVPGRIDWSRAVRTAVPAAPAGSAALVTAAPDHGRTWRDIRALLTAAALPERVRRRALAAFGLLAEAEAAVHGTTVESIHFHEVGALDAIADVVGCALALELLGIDRVVCAPITPGSGVVRCAHGLMPVPVPAVAEMLRRSGAPVRLLAQATGELTTPTGACLAISLADAWVGAEGSPAIGTLVATGLGAGTKEIPGLVNAVRVYVVEHSTTVSPLSTAVAPLQDVVAELTCQVDDATGESLALLIGELLAAGALDAWLTPIVMKKGRPGHRIDALCRVEDQPAVVAALLAGSPTLGVRVRTAERRVLQRSASEITIEGLKIRCKTASLPDGTTRTKAESDDVAAAAKAWGITALEAAARIRRSLEY